MEDTTTTDSATEAMKAAGVATESHVFVDYFDFSDTRKVELPQGGYWVEIQVLNEGARRKYLNSTNRDVTIQRATGDAKMSIASGDDRHALLKAAIVDWNLKTKNQKTGEIDDVRFNERTLDDFLAKAPPTIIDVIEKEVRKDNPWLVADITIEQIDEQIEQLEEMREQKIKENEGKDS